MQRLVDHAVADFPQGHSTIHLQVAIAILAVVVREVSTEETAGVFNRLPGDDRQEWIGRDRGNDLPIVLLVFERGDRRHTNELTDLERLHLFTGKRRMQTSLLSM